MIEYPEAEKIGELVAAAKHVVVVQADNPDADSLACSLALEEILGELGKRTSMYCGVDLPTHLRYIAGWDRVSKELPKQFDLSIIVDTCSATLLEQLDISQQAMWLKSKPSIVIDHHAIECTLDFATVVCNKPAVATGEVIYELCRQLDWPRNQRANQLISIAILTDSLGLISEGTGARSIHIIGELVEQGVSLAELENARRAMLRRPSELIHYKGRLLQRVEFYSNERIALICIPWEEIERYSSMYNPSMLVLDDMRLGIATQVAIAFKLYNDNRITAKIRSNYGSGIAGRLAEHFGGGGHPYASGFKVQDGRSYEALKQECLEVAAELLDKLSEQP